MQRTLLTSLRTSLGVGITLGALSALSGCTAPETVHSDAIRTKGIYAKFEAVAGTKSTRVYSELRVGGKNGDYVDLVSGDQLTATFGEDSKDLPKDKDGYSHTFTGTEGGTPINVNFKRGEDAPAPDSNAELPPEFSLSLASDSIPRDKSVAVDLGEASPDSELEWKVNGNCIFPGSGRSADTGKLTLAPSEIDATKSAEDDECSVTLTVDRVQTGTVDSAFGEGGEFRAIQRRSVAFTSLPVPKQTQPNTDAGASTPSAVPSATEVPSAEPVSDAGVPPIETADAG